MVDEQANDDGFDQESSDIAIVGMACRFPDADNPRQYWENLQRGHESITELTNEELLSSGVSKEQLKNPNYVKSGMFLPIIITCFVVHHPGSGWIMSFSRCSG
jgi:acyl transferase domain-containing protein